MIRSSHQSHRLLFACAAACLVTGLSGSLLGQSAGRSVALSPPLPAHEPVGRWCGNALVNISGHISHEPIILVHAASGEEIERVAIKASPTGTLQVLNDHFARSADGHIAVTGANYGDGDRGATFLNIISPGGTSQKVFRTEPYLPVAVTFSSDGNIWLAGWEVDERGRDKGPGSTYAMLRVLDKSGRQVRGVAARSEFATQVPPVPGSSLVASKDRVGWFAPMAGRYMEFALDGTRLTDVAFPVSLQDTAGVALCEDNSVWALASSSDGSVTFKELDRDRGVWIDHNRIDPGVYLYGCSGTSLITSKDAEKAIEWRNTR